MAKPKHGPPIWEREGFRTEYAYRTRGTSPGTQERREAAGKAGYQSLRQILSSGRAGSVDASWRGGRDPKTGRAKELVVAVTVRGGGVREYRIRNPNGNQVRSIEARARKGKVIMRWVSSPVKAARRAA